MVGTWRLIYGRHVALLFRTISTHLHPQTSLLRVTSAASADASARSGGLDRALGALLQTLHGVATPAADGDHHATPSRVDILEQLVGFVQAIHLLPAPMDTVSQQSNCTHGVDVMQLASDAIRHVAQLAGVDAGCADATHVLASVRAWLDGCIPALPGDFFEPVVRETQFSQQQVWGGLLCICVCVAVNITQHSLQHSPHTQMQMLEQVNSMLHDDYTQRRAALLARTRVCGVCCDWHHLCCCCDTHVCVIPMKNWCQTSHTPITHTHTHTHKNTSTPLQLALQAMEASPRMSEEDSGAKLAAIAAQADAWTSTPSVSIEQLFQLTHGI